MDGKEESCFRKVKVLGTRACIESPTSGKSIYRVGEPFTSQTAQIPFMEAASKDSAGFFSSRFALNSTSFSLVLSRSRNLEDVSLKAGVHYLKTCLRLAFVCNVHQEELLVRLISNSRQISFKEVSSAIRSESFGFNHVSDCLNGRT